MLKEFYIDGKTFKNTTKLNFFINTVQFFFYKQSSRKFGST